MRYRTIINIYISKYVRDIVKKIMFKEIFEHRQKLNIVYLRYYNFFLSQHLISEYELIWNHNGPSKRLDCVLLTF